MDFSGDIQAYHALPCEPESSVYSFVRNASIFYLGAMLGPSLVSVWKTVKPFALLGFEFGIKKLFHMDNPSEKITNVPSLFDTFKDSYESSMFDTSQDDAKEAQEDETSFLSDPAVKEAIEALMSMRQATLEASKVVEELRSGNFTNETHVNHILRSEKVD
jgi:hypothetical protein